MASDPSHRFFSPQRPPAPRATARAAACLVATLLTAAQAQPQAPADASAAQTVTIRGRSQAPLSLSGFDDVPLSRAPFSASVLGTGQLQDAGIATLGDLTRLDAGITDAYNAPGYWGQLAVRGFTLDNRFNYRRDGLPINGETAIPLANKQAIELLKGTSGIQAGTSAPGGLVNLVVKRPRDQVASLALSWAQGGERGVALDIGQRSGSTGWRLNAETEALRPPVRGVQGSRHQLALALEQQLPGGSLLEAELEWSRQRMPSTPGISLLGSQLPPADGIDPRLNLNDQAWTQPMVMQGLTASLRHTLALQGGWSLVTQLMRQRLDSDDRVAFPYGCSAENTFDRYCVDGSFDLYDYRSDNERRTSDAAAATLKGRLQLAGITHHLSLGLLATRYSGRFQDQAFNGVGTGSLLQPVALPADPRLTDVNTNRSERSTELSLQDRIALGPATTLWAGLRASRLQRDSVRTDGSRPTAYAQSLATPWLALSQALDAQQLLYASWGQGMESEVAPNRARYTNAGQALPALKSRQIELGWKLAGEQLDLRLAAFDIRRPVWRDLGACDGSDDSCTRQIDGAARHRGVEAEADWRLGAWNLRASAMLLRARREGSSDPVLNGLRPTNVPASSLKLQALYNMPAVPGLALVGFVTHEGNRMVLPDNSIATPGWTRLDLLLRYSHQLLGRPAVWRLGLDNLADRRAWKEAPYQFDHAYLYPLAPRNLHASLTLRF